MPYLMILIMISSKFFENLKKEQINPQPKYNLMALNKMMINVQNKQTIDLGRKESQQNKDVAYKPTKYKACKVSIIFYESFKKYRIKDNSKVNFEQIGQLLQLSNNQYLNFD